MSADCISRPIVERPGHLIRRLKQIATALFLEETAELDLTPVQYAALTTIAATPGLDQATLARRIAFDQATVLKVLDRLGEKQLVTRRRSPTSRRTNELNITQAGRDTLDRIGPMLDRLDRRILAPLDATEQQVFMQLLTRLVANNNEFSRAPMSRRPSDLLPAEQPREAP